MTKALVTEATRAPGRAIAASPAKEGWEMHALGRERIARGEHGIVPMAMNLTDREYVRAVAEGSEPDVLAHTGHRWPEERWLLGLREADIDMALEVNVSATKHITRAVLPSLIERAAAGALDGFARAVAEEVQHSGIFVHCLSLGQPSFRRLGSDVLALLLAPGFQSQFTKHQEHGYGT